MDAIILQALQQDVVDDAHVDTWQRGETHEAKHPTRALWPPAHPAPVCETISLDESATEDAEPVTYSTSSSTETAAGLETVLETETASETNNPVAQSTVNRRDLKKNTTIAFKKDGEWWKGEVVSRAGKVASKKGKGKEGKYEHH